MIRAALLRPSPTALTAIVAPRTAAVRAGGSNKATVVRRRFFVAGPGKTSSPSSSLSSPSPVPVAAPSSLLRANNNCIGRRPVVAALRTSSTQKESSSTGKSQTSSTSGEGTDPTSQEIVLTPGEKVVAGTRLTLWAGAFAFASVCAYYIGKELLPTKMSPNTVFDKATALIRQNDEVRRRFGEFKTYGRDHGGHREGRRNFIEHTEYNDPDDGSKRTRVRFNLEGSHGASAFVFAEVSKDMASGEFVYILVQDKRNGMVINVVDNRSALLAKRLAAPPLSSPPLTPSTPLTSRTTSPTSSTPSLKTRSSNGESRSSTTVLTFSPRLTPSSSTPHGAPSPRSVRSE